ncbi:MAG: hypothetical protein COT17_01285 [Elusimicrobia bacterium CG08_land_8_20_14_0_20_51_18]|nr:MAG: hypothetical protein COT17_01285 [Elusimicrobia bacterium CG08_land_8_20_14_0_20_51_18]
MKFSKIILTLSFLAFLPLGSGALETGDMLYTGGWFGMPYSAIGELPLGHVSVFAGFEKEGSKVKAVIVDCVPDYFKPGGIRKVSWKHFTHNFSYPYYGNRTTKERPSREQRKKIAELALSMAPKKVYSFTHTSQKGPVEFDCVGFVEYVYEKIGLNPTPDDQETGAGWPLTPSEQFFATAANENSAKPYANMSFSLENGPVTGSEVFKSVDSKYFEGTEGIPVPVSFETDN